MSIDEQLSKIENEVFISTKHKLDTYSLSMVRATLLANELLAKSNNKVEISNEQLIQEVKDKIKGSITTEQNVYYDAISAFWGNAGKYSFPSLAFIVLVYFLFTYLEDTRKENTLYKDSERVVLSAKLLEQKKPEVYKEFFSEAVENLNSNKSNGK